MPVGIFLTKSTMQFPSRIHTGAVGARGMDPPAKRPLAPWAAPRASLQIFHAALASLAPRHKPRTSHSHRPERKSAFDARASRGPYRIHVGPSSRPSRTRVAWPTSPLGAPGEPGSHRAHGASGKDALGATDARGDSGEQYADGHQPHHHDHHHHYHNGFTKIIACRIAHFAGK